MNHQYRSIPAAPILPIAPSPSMAVAGQKRKLAPNTATATGPVGTGGVPIHSTSTTSVPGIASGARSGRIAATTSMIPRRETAPAMVTSASQNAGNDTTMADAGSGRHNANTSQAATISPKPSEYWKSLLDEWKVPILDTVGIEQDDNDGDSNIQFLETTADRIEAYQNIELLTAVRRRDLSTLKRIASGNAANGKTMNACNRFGESILHLACRKGSLEVVQLLVNGKASDGCDCSLLVRDDYGRTVLHDACWTVNPPWELIKLILKKAPVLWRVSDVRGHLALQYVPKSAWPQWTAFLSKNKDLLQRIMVHSYHKIDILHQQQRPQAVPVPVPAPSSMPQHRQQRQQPPIKTEEGSAAQPSQPMVYSSSTAAAATATNLPRHPAAPVSAARATIAASAQRSVVARSSAEAALSLATGGGIAQVSAQQAQDVLARALAKASPAMVKALSGPAPQLPLQQGLQTLPPRAQAQPAAVVVAAAVPVAAAPIKREQPEESPPSATGPSVSAPGPATAALDEALRVQSETRAKGRSSFLLAGEHSHNKQGSAAAPSDGDELQSQHHRAPAQTPIPYAPSISMIAARLAGYQKATTSSSTVAAAAVGESTVGVSSSQAPAPSGATFSSPLQQQQQPPQAQPPTPARNPLPAVPNPLLVVNSESHPANTKATMGVGVPSSITTNSIGNNYQQQHETNTNPSAPPVPNPMASQEDPNSSTGKTSGDDAVANSNSNGNNSISNGNSTSSVTMSASPSVVEETLSTTTTTTTSDTDSDQAGSSHLPASRSGSHPREGGQAAVVAPATPPVNQPASAIADKDEQDGSKKWVVG